MQRICRKFILRLFMTWLPPLPTCIPGHTPTVTRTCSLCEPLTSVPSAACFKPPCLIGTRTPYASCLVGEQMHPLSSSSDISHGLDALPKFSRQCSRCTINKCLNSLFNNKVAQNALKKCSTHLKRFIVLCPIS